MILPAPVLPSNAPPLPLQDDNGVQHASRVLQEQSGNRRLVDFNTHDEYEAKYPLADPVETGYSQNHVQQLPTQHVYRSQQQHPHQPRQPYRYGYGRHGYRSYLTPQQEAKLQYDADRLYRRFRQSDQYVKYRARQSKDDKGNRDQKWPEELEKAFFRALVQHPPMGRRKMLHKDKQRGRNELIADCIEELTGEFRSRKQVSSHIQVLKPFVENDPHIMKWLSKDDMGLQRGGTHGHPLAFGTGRQMSNYPVPPLPHSARSAMSTFYRPNMYALQSVKGSLDIFAPTDFQMFVQRKFRNGNGDEDVERLHEYTKSVYDPLAPDLVMNDWSIVSRDFPLLAKLSNHRALDCNVLIAEASIAFPTETWKDKDGSPLPGVELGISFICGSHHLPPTPREAHSQVLCNNSFYENGILAEGHSASSEVRWEPSRPAPSVETQIKFGSTFWASTLGRLATKLRDTSKDHKEEVASYLRSINALQEVVVLSDHGPERILIIHWSFRQSSSTCGRASWRRLLLPTTQQSPYDETVKPERADSMFETYSHYGESSVSQTVQPQPQPALQSPFEYEGSSGSALSSATRPTSFSEGSIIEHHPDHAHISAENSFDFNAGNINIAYDPTFNFENFDSSAFTFDATTGDCAADPALHDYSQEWCNSQVPPFDVQHVIGNSDHFGAAIGLDGHGQNYDDGYEIQYKQHSYDRSHDQQAYGGAGPDMIKEEDALAALADASYIASALGT